MFERSERFDSYAVVGRPWCSESHAGHVNNYLLSIIQNCHYIIEYKYDVAMGRHIFVLLYVLVYIYKCIRLGIYEPKPSPQHRDPIDRVEKEGGKWKGRCLDIAIIITCTDLYTPSVARAMTSDRRTRCRKHHPVLQDSGGVDVFIIGFPAPQIIFNPGHTFRQSSLW